MGPSAAPEGDPAVFTTFLSVSSAWVGEYSVPWHFRDSLEESGEV